MKHSSNLKLIYPVLMQRIVVTKLSIVTIIILESTFHTVYPMGVSTGPFSSSFFPVEQLMW